MGVNETDSGEAWAIEELDLPPIGLTTWTTPCERFHDESWRTVRFLHFVVLLATHVDEMTKIASEALKNMGHETDGPRRSALEDLRRYRTLLLQMVMTRAVNNFLTYVVELLSLIFRTRPETLRSSETVKVAEVLSHGSLEELVEWLTERRVERLSYEGMRDLAKDVADRLGLDLFASDETLEIAVGIVEERNLIVHNRAVVNKRYLSRVTNSPLREGDVLDYEYDDVMLAVVRLMRSGYDLDGRAAPKFGLPTHAVTSTISRE